MQIKNSEDILKYFQEKNISNDKSNHWKKLIGDKFNNINLQNLENFRNNGLSDGLDNSHSLNKDILIKNYDYFKKSTAYRYFNNFSKKNIGNNTVFLKFSNYYVDNNQIDNLYLFALINEFILKKNKIQKILEIGAGYGQLASTIIFNNRCKYFFIDLKENLLLQIYFLNKTYPGLRIYAHKDEDIFDKKIIDNFDLFFFTNINYFKACAQLKFDLVINSCSFMEMKKKQVEAYFLLIQKTLKINSFFFNHNRYFKDSSGDKIRFYEYPYDDKYSVKYSSVFHNFRRIHTLITKRIKKMGNILKELNRIKNLSKNHEYPSFIPITIMKIYRYLKKFNYLPF
jgi:putative sugar O-methyltransferase